VAQQLDAALAGFAVPTAVVREPQLIDHIAHSPDMRSVGGAQLISQVMDGVELSDHTGVSIQLASRSQP